MSRSQTLVAPLTAIVALLFSFGAALAQVSGNSAVNERLEIRLNSPRKAYLLGKPIALRIEIWNKGVRPLFIGQRFFTPGNWMYGLSISVQNARGEKSGQSGSVVHGYSRPEGTFASALVRDWVVLPPGYFYGTTTTVDARDFDFLKKAGRYRIRIAYRSSGLHDQSALNALRNEQEEIAKLPYESWEGEVESNSVWVEVRSQVSGRRSNK